MHTQRVHKQHERLCHTWRRTSVNPGEAMIRTALVIVAAISLSALSLLAQATPEKPLSGFDRVLIDQQQRILQAIGRKDSTVVEDGVADDFQGIAANGELFDKSEVVESSQEGMPTGTRAYDFHVVKLSEASAVVIYNLILPGRHPRYCHMSDAWAKIDGRWKLKFRQATPNLWSANDLD